MHNILYLAVISGLIICFITFIDTNFALVILIFSMLLSPEIPVGAVGAREVVIRFDDILLIVVFISWLVKIAVNKELGLLKQTRLNLPIVVYIIILIVTTLFGLINGYVDLLKSIFFVLKYIEYYMLFFMVTNNIKSQRQVKVFIFFILVTAMIASIWSMQNMASSQLKRASAPFETVGGARGEPNTFGGYLLFICAIIAGRLLYSRDILRSLSLAGLGILVLVTLSNTLSRGSYIGFLAMFLVLTILSDRKKPLLIFMIVLFLFTYKFIFPERIIERVTKTFVPERIYEPWAGVRITLDYSASARVESWEFALKKWKSNPLLGYGVTGAGFIDTQFPLVLAETGIVGLLVYIWLLATIFKESLWIFKNAGDEYFRSISLGFIAGFIGLLIHSFSAATFIIIRIMEPFWFLTAIVMMLPEIQGLKDGA